MIKQASVYTDILVNALEHLADYESQKQRWFAQKGSVFGSFSEDCNEFYDDSLLGEALQNNKIILDPFVTQALRDVVQALDRVDEFREPQLIIEDPKMQSVREKAAQALALIQASDGRESTVEIVE